MAMPQHQLELPIEGLVPPSSIGCGISMPMQKRNQVGEKVVLGHHIAAQLHHETRMSFECIAHVLIANLGADSAKDWHT